MFGETTNLHELDGHEVVFVARFPGAHLINIDIVIGSRLPTFFTASGTAILSALPEEERVKWLAQVASLVEAGETPAELPVQVVVGLTTASAGFG